MSSNLEAALYLQLRAVNLIGGMEQEYRFAAMATGGTGPGVRARLQEADLRDWRIDFAWPEKKLAVEVEGGTWVGGRHTRGKGFEEDCDKYNKMVLMGWRLLRFTGTAIKSGVALQCVETALAQTWTTGWEISA